MITLVHKFIIEKGCKMKKLTKHLIYKTISTTNFIRRIEWRKMLEYLDPKEDERILDIACGNGTLALKIAERRCEVHGIDISKDSIDTARRLAEREKIACQFKVGNAENLPYPNMSFDKIVCSSSLEHFKNDISALKEMSRIIKPNGRLIITVDSFTYPITNELKEKHKKSSYVINYYTSEKLKKKFEIVGIKMNKSEYLLNSRITSFFFNIGIKMKWSGKIWILISFIAYPLCLVSDKLFGAKNKGYTLIAEGLKTNPYQKDI